MRMRPRETRLLTTYGRCKMLPLIGMLAGAVGAGGTQSVNAWSRLQAIRENNQYKKSMAQTIEDSNIQAQKAQDQTDQSYQRQAGVSEPTSVQMITPQTTITNQALKIPVDYQEFLNKINKLGGIL